MAGLVEVEGVDADYVTAPLEEIFARAFDDQAFDVTELSFSNYLYLTSTGDCPYVGLPVFPSRAFRHSAIYIRTDRGIEKPEDLRGKLVGTPEYQMTAPVWMRGILDDQYGIKSNEIRWRSGGQEEAGRDERTPFEAPEGLDLEPIPEDRTLVEMFEAGELDALTTAREPSSFTLRKPNIGRLFSDFRSVEKEYYRDTGIFPIMHLMGLRKDLAEKHPWLAGSLYKAFLEARDIAYQDIAKTAALSVALPWVAQELQDTVGLMGPDYWKYGIEECRHEIEALARYSYNDGLSERLLTPEDLFAESTFDISRI